MKSVITLVLLLGIVSSPARSQDNTGTSSAPMSIGQAIRIALERNHRIRIARVNADIARNNTTRGSAGFLPTLDATGALSLARSEQQTNSPFSFGTSTTAGGSAQIGLNWTIFDGFRMFAEHDRYNELASLGEYQSRALTEQTVVSVVRAYLQTVQQQQLLGVLRDALDISRVRYQKAEVRRELGGTATEYLNARIAYNTDSSTVLGQELALDIARRELNLLLGREASEALFVETEVLLPEYERPLPVLLDMARDRNADLRAAEQTLRVAESSITVSRSAFFPRLSLFANYGYSDRLVSSNSPRFDEDISTQSLDGTVGLNLSFNLFNGFRNVVDVQNAELERHAIELAFDEARQRIDALVREQFLTLQTRRGIVELEEENLDAARRNLALQLERFETGTIGSLEFRDAQLQLVRAETAAIVARFQARIALLELQRLIGDMTL